jgi:signal transduction histidine kinase
MQKAIAERDQQLREQNRTLRETNELLDRTLSNYMHMLGFITHELKSPLATVQAMVANMIEGYTGELPEKASEVVVRIKRILEETQDMVKNYLDLSHVERGEMTAKKADIDFRTEVIEPSILQAETLFKSRNITLEVSAPDQIPVLADPELMRIALTNYLTNAAKYGREGSVARLEAAIEENELRVSVWNEGEGFTEEEGENLFGKFFRIRNQNTRNKRGSGLGLFICRQIVELHGGRTWADSEPGQWARFSLSFPLSS